MYTVITYPCKKISNKRDLKKIIPRELPTSYLYVDNSIICFVELQICHFSIPSYIRLHCKLYSNDNDTSYTIEKNRL